MYLALPLIRCIHTINELATKTKPHIQLTLIPYKQPTLHPQIHALKNISPSPQTRLQRAATPTENSTYKIVKGSG